MDGIRSSELLLFMHVQLYYLLTAVNILCATFARFVPCTIV